MPSAVRWWPAPHQCTTCKVKFTTLKASRTGGLYPKELWAGTGNFPYANSLWPTWYCWGWGCKEEAGWVEEVVINLSFCAVSPLRWVLAHFEPLLYPRVRVAPRSLPTRVHRGWKPFPLYCSTLWPHLPLQSILSSRLRISFSFSEWARPKGWRRAQWIQRANMPG